MRTIVNMTIFLGIALVYVLVGIIATTIIALSDGSNVLFLDEMWSSIFLWWLMLIIYAIKECIRKLKHKIH